LISVLCSSIRNDLEYMMPATNVRCSLTISWLMPMPQFPR
jgi:LSD1 subclass zinc finger protein